MKNSLKALLSTMLTVLLSILFLSVPHAIAFPSGPRMDKLQINFYNNQQGLYSGFRSCEIDFMASKLTYTMFLELKCEPQYQFIRSNNNDMYEIDINNNETLDKHSDPVYRYASGYVSPTSFEQFRQAIAYLMDKEWLISIIHGFGSRIDTPISRPYFDNTGWVEYERSRWGPLGEDLGNYPYEYNPAAAAALLDEMGFVQGTTPNPDYDPALPWSAQYIRVYPSEKPIYVSAVWALAALQPGGVNRVFPKFVAGEGDYVDATQDVVINLPWPVHGDWTVCRRLRVYYCPEPGTTDRKMIELVKGVDYTYDPGTGKVIIDTCAIAGWWPPTPGALFTIEWQKCTKTLTMAGQNIHPLYIYTVNEHPRREAALQHAYCLRTIGIPVVLVTGSHSYCYTWVIDLRAYHLYFGGWSLGRYPTYFYSLYTPDGIFPGGPNYPQINEDAITYWARRQYLYPMDAADSLVAAKACQMLLVDKCNIIGLYSSRGFYAYKAGWLGVVTTTGYGLTLRYSDYMFLNLYHENPAVKIIKYGLPYPPDELNPVFSGVLANSYHVPICGMFSENQILEQIFGRLINPNPVKPSVPGKSPAGSDQPWIAKDWKHEWIDFNGNGLVDEGDKSNVTYWIRDDVWWQGNSTMAPWPLTIEDIEYTQWLVKSYPDAWEYGQLDFLEAIYKPGRSVIQFIYSVPSFWSLYWPLSPLPEKVYRVIPDHHTGQYGGPGNLPLEATLISSNLWKLQEVIWGVGGHIIFDACRIFFLEGLLGDIDFAYYFNPGAPPQGGCYKVALADLVILAKAYGSKGNCDPDAGNGPSLNWNPACDLAKPSCVIGLTDLVSLAKVYGQTWGCYDP